MSVGVVIGRFQIDEMHDGHVKLLEYVRSKHDNILILLGVRQSPANKTYPLDFDARRLMIQEYCNDALILPVVDRPSDEAWSRHVDELVESAYPTQNVCLYGGRDSFTKHYCGKYETKELAFPVDDVSASAVRDKIGKKVRSSVDFRAGVIYAIQNLMPRIYSTVDIAMVDYTNRRVLMAKKPFEKAFRFPGGFVDFNDACLEQAAFRELFEETGMSSEDKSIDYIGSFSVNDWRNTDDTKIMTTLFAVNYS